MGKISKFISLVLVACMVVGLLPVMSAAAADAPDSFMVPVKVTTSSFWGESTDYYLSTANSNAFNMFMYSNTFSGTFGDQHMGGLELSLNGTRIATNGDLHLLPTPEQWDATPAPQKGQVAVDEENNTITVPMTYTPKAGSQLQYDLVASSTDDGVRLQMILKSDMPEDLQGKARFNLEFLPASYESKTYQVDTDADGDYDDHGVFPLHPQDGMEEVERADLDQEWYVEEWNTDRGDAQPLPFATGKGFSFAPEDKNSNISIDADKNSPTLELYDGRNRAQNGWYVLSSLLTATKAGDVAIDWTITPSVEEGWVRPANVGFSQVGYSPDQKKFAVVELDKWGTIGEDYPADIALYRVNADGSEEKVASSTLKEEDCTAWMRYKYVRFDFTNVKEAGLYRIKYGDQVGEIFPIDKDVYDDVWQTTLSGFLAVQMDHISVRDGYRIWHGAAHMDDGSVPVGKPSYFDGMGMPAELPQAIKDKGIEPEEHVDGLNVGGWFDAGDFDIQTSRNVQVLGELIEAAESSGNMEDYDTLSVEWDDTTGGTVEMHRPDGIPDIVQQAVHGSKQLLAQYTQLGGIGGTMEVRTLRQYTHLGDPSSDTDGYIYDPALKEDEIVERAGKVYSGVPDDRYFLLSGGGGSFSSDLFSVTQGWFGGMNYNNANPKNFAGTAYLAAEYYPDYAAKLMNAANEIWMNELYTEEPNYALEWDALVQYALATHKLEELKIKYNDYDGKLNYAYYKARLDGMVNQALEAGVGSKINLLFIKDLMDADYWSKVKASVEAYAASYQTNTQPYGVDFTSGSGWGGSPNTYSGVRGISMMYNFFPMEEFEDGILNSVNYLLGRHPATNASWISGVGTKSALHPYNSNRAEESYIPGSILPGHITFLDYAESFDDFSYLWFEGESIINYQSSWLPVGLAAGKIAHNDAEPKDAATKDFTSTFDAKLVKKVTQGWFGTNENSYWADDGFNVFMYNSNFSSAFGDQHCAGIELIQDGRRIATNGDIHLLPTPEQWDATPAPKVDKRTFEDSKITVDMTWPEETLADGTVNPAVKYHLITEPEPGGIKLTVKLDEKLPADMVGKAGFNLEFLPAVYVGKSFQASSDGKNYDSYGVFPLTPADDMEEVSRARTANQAWYVQQWNEDRGDYQPLPFATGKKMTFAAEDDDYRIRISSDDELALYDGRNRAQNGWFVLRTLIPADKTEIVWHISPDTTEDWTREPNITHNQAGYEPNLSKVAMLELDQNYKGSETANLKELNADGTYTTIYTGKLGAPTNWQRYTYRTFDFSSVKEPGTYVIEYDGYTSDPFPIKKGAYAKIWQQSVSNYLAVQMDHMRIREGYKIWRNAAHMDDALQAPTGMDWFDAGTNGRQIDTGYKPYERIPGLDVGGFSDAGDFDIQTGDNISVIANLALAYEIFQSDYDTLDVDWETHNVEMHRPDGMPDLVQLAKHGALNILAQNQNIGFLASVIEVQTLRQYTHLGDGSKDTDNRYYDPALQENETIGRYSGKKDDRLAFAFTKNSGMQMNAAAALAQTGKILKDFDDPYAEKFIAEAEKIWQEEGGNNWNVAVELYNATGKDVYKDYIVANFDAQMTNSRTFTSSGWKAARIVNQLGEEYADKFETALKANASALEALNTGTPFGIAASGAGWGNAGDSAAAGANTVAVLHKLYPDIISADKVFHSINYVLGTHPYDSTSYVSGVGTKSAEMGYGSNRADHYYIAGGIVPGYCTLAPDFPEYMDDFNFLWFENEYTVRATSNWILTAIGAEEFAREQDDTVAAAKKAAEKAAEAQKAAEAAQAAAETARAAADEAAASAAADKTAAEAARAAADEAQAKAEAAQAAADEAAKAAAASDEAAAEKAAAAADDAAKAAKSASDAATAQAAAQAAQGKAEAAQKAAEAAQAKADEAASKGEGYADEAKAAQDAADKAKDAAESAKTAAEAAKTAADASNTAAAKSAADAADAAAQAADALKQVAEAQIKVAEDRAAADAAAKQAAEDKAAAEEAQAKAEAAQKAAEEAQAKAEAAQKAAEEALKALENTKTCPSAKFTDVPAEGDWAHEGIDYCVAAGLMDGVGADKFNPSGTLTRAQLVTILYRLADEPDVTTEGTFTDVQEGQWYTNAIEWAAANEIVNGVGDRKFNPNGAVTREQIAAILYRYNKSPAVTGDLSKYPDNASVSSYAKDAMVWATGEGLINGVGSGSTANLAPKNSATRAQIASIIMRYATK